MSDDVKRVVIGSATLYLGDCRDILPTLPKVDAVITDPPYGTTRCRWDVAIPFSELWLAIRCVTGRSVPILMFGAEPFSSALRQSNLGEFKFDWIWEKPKASGHLNAKRQPLRAHEIVSVFCAGPAPYFPQKTQGHERKSAFKGAHLQTDVYGRTAQGVSYDSTERYPRTVLRFSQDTQRSSEHPTQKPVALMEYLVKTHSAMGSSVIDPFMGSGTTGVACMNLGRSFIGIERESKYFDIACRRIEEACRNQRLIA
ncbi:DNA-methyltransferase [Arenimonas sp.]|uniref:DNA-methyltransferase n=1 Tax=Arenimonas sp. TaxID=1872635 RepID=UPI0039E47E3B